MNIIRSTHTSLKKINDTAVLLTADHKSNIIDFREMNSGCIQIISEGGDVNDGTFSLEISLHCDPTTFAPYPSGDIQGCADGNSIWILNHIPFQFGRICYTKGTDTVGTFNIYTRAKK